MSSEEDNRKKAVNDMFGDESDSDDDAFKPAAKAVHADASGLFGSDSESEDEKPKKLKKAPKVKAEVKPTKSSSLKRKSRDEDARPAAGEGDEYDSGEEAVRTKEDDAFIDNDDDLDDVLNEYGNDKQEFHDERPDEDDEPSSRRQREPDYFDETLKSLKSGRAKSKMALSQQEMESLTQELLYRMDKAHSDDVQAMEEHRPALEKLKFVDNALMMMRKVQLQPMLLDFDLLGIIKKWIQPMESGTLPNLSLRSKMLDMCQRMPIYKEHLKRSSFGKAIMALWKHPDETPENKELCRQMIDRWSRSVFSKTLDYSKLAELEAEKREANGGYYRQAEKRPTGRTESVRNRGFLNKRTDANEDADASSRVRIPQAMRFDFSLRPQPKVDVKNLPTNKLDPDSKKAKLMKRMQIIARPSKGGKRAVKMSIEGRGFYARTMARTGYEGRPILAMDMRIVYGIYRRKEVWPMGTALFHSLASRYRTHDVSVVLWFIFLFMTPELGFPYVWSCVGNFVVVLVMQNVIQARRPIDYDARLYLPACTDPDTMGFPSLDSHMAIVIVGPALVLPSISGVTSMVFAAVILLVGASRVVVGMRFPSQVVASWVTGAIGVGVASFCHAAVRPFQLPAFVNRVVLLLVIVSALFCVAAWVERSECRVVGVPKAEFTRVLGSILHGDGSDGSTGAPKPTSASAHKRDSFYFLMKALRSRRGPAMGSTHT
ncbi:hypothetical protein ACHHYP_08323 [Achlya hypogyna]|uniref:TFIIS N-terminal domain-containing protein n=1 Tax=Achlya hypogyna TaxID=1202772 RepID=A0A1V9ZKU1_ACHHY|nr:hypothetical protein ACHHYP_08323 [Achlya hypogyna]